MSNKRSALKPSECENVSDKSKKGKILNLGLYRRRKISALRHRKGGEKKKCRGLTVGLTIKNLQTGLQTYQNKCTKFNFFISLNVVWLFYITCNWFMFIKMLSLRQ